MFIIHQKCPGRSRLPWGTTCPANASHGLSPARFSIASTRALVAVAFPRIGSADRADQRTGGRQSRQSRRAAPTTVVSRSRAPRDSGMPGHRGRNVTVTIWRPWVSRFTGVAQARLPERAAVPGTAPGAAHAAASAAAVGVVGRLASSPVLAAAAGAAGVCRRGTRDSGPRGTTVHWGRRSGVGRLIPVGSNRVCPGHDLADNRHYVK